MSGQNLALAPVKFDFLDRILLQGTDCNLQYRPQDEDRPYDIIEHIIEVIVSGGELQPVSDEYHKTFMSQTDVPLEQSWSSEEGLRLIYDEFREYLATKAKDEDEKTAFLTALDKEVWPELKPILARNKNTADLGKTLCNLFIVRGELHFEYR